MNERDFGVSFAWLQEIIGDLGLWHISISLLIFYTEATPFFPSFPESSFPKMSDGFEDLRIPLLLWNGPEGKEGFWWTENNELEFETNCTFAFWSHIEPQNPF